MDTQRWHSSHSWQLFPTIPLIKKWWCVGPSAGVTLLWLCLVSAGLQTNYKLHQWQGTHLGPCVPLAYKTESSQFGEMGDIFSHLLLSSSDLQFPQPHMRQYASRDRPTAEKIHFICKVVQLQLIDATKQSRVCTWAQHYCIDLCFPWQPKVWLPLPCTNSLLETFKTAGIGQIMLSKQKKSIWI